MKKIERSRPTRYERRIGGHHPRGAEKEGERSEGDQGPERGSVRKNRAGEVKDKPSRDKPTHHPADSYPELVVPKDSGTEVDKDRHQRWMVDISRGEVIRVLPIVRFFDEEVWKPDRDEPDKHKEPDPEPRSREPPPGGAHPESLSRYYHQLAQ